MNSRLSEARLRVTKPLDKVSAKTGHSPYRVFTDFLDLTISSFAGDESQYSTLVQRYRDDGHDTTTIENLLQLYAQALGGLVIGVEETHEDVLGAVYEHYSTASDSFAQHFTSGSVSGTMAEIGFPDKNEIYDASPDDPLLIGDISGCGSGTLLLESARRLRTIRPGCPAIFVGWDIDSDCAKMCVINFVLHGLPGYVLQGDALRAEINRCWQIDPTRLQHDKMPLSELSESESDALLDLLQRVIERFP